MPPAGRKDGLIDLKMVCSLNVLVILFLWFLLWLLFNDAYLF